MRSVKRKVSAAGGSAFCGKTQSLKLLVLSFSFALLTLRFVLSCCAGDVQFEATVDRNKAALGEALQLNLTFQGTQNSSVPKLEKIEGFDARYLGPSTMVSIVNGVVTSSVTYIYTLVPLKTGTFHIGPFSAVVEGKTLTSKSITVEVASTPSTGQQPNLSNQLSQGPSSAKIDSEDLKDRIFLILSAGKRQAYLNEVIPLTIKLYVNRLGVRDIQFPVLETNDFSIEKFKQPRQYREEFGGVAYDVIEFTADMFGIKPGGFTLGPARLKCNLLVRKQNQRRANPFGDDAFSGFFDQGVFDDFFGKYEVYPVELKSMELPITVLALPEEGKPDSFNGALGEFRLDVEATPLQVKAGDPVTLRMTVRGEGNFDTVKCPALETRDDFKVYDPQVKQNENEKIFERALIPNSENITCVPRINFSFFNTKTGQYQVLTRDPIPITVARAEYAQAKLVELPQAQTKPAQKEELGRDIIYIKSSPGDLKRIGRYLYRRAGFWLFQVLSFIAFIVVIVFHLKRQRIKTDTRYARRLRAPRKAKRGIQEVARLLNEGKTEAFFDAVFRIIREYLADRFHLPSGGITAITIEEIAKEKGIADETLDKIKKIFSDCDMARYAPSQFGQEKMREISQALKEIIDYLERQKV